MADSTIRILMFDNEFPPLGGGTGIVNYHFFRVWAKREDVHVDLITAHPGKTEIIEEAFSERIRLIKVPVDNVNPHHARNGELLRYTRRAWAEAKRLLAANTYDVTFAFSAVPAGVLSWRTKRKYKLPYIVSLEGADIPGFEARYNGLYPFLKPILRPVYCGAGFITAISQEQWALANHFLPDLDIPIVPNGVDTAVFHPPETVPDPDRPLRLVHVGRLIERKGQHHLLRAFAQAKKDLRREARVVLVGTGDAEDELKGLAASLELGDAVEFTGAVPLEAMPGIYRNADVFVLPSQNEGMSLGLLEAIASGLPVIATPVGGTRELVDEVNGKVVPWADVDALAEALVHWVNDDEARSLAATRSRETAEKFDWERVAGIYLDAAYRLKGASPGGGV